MGESNKKISLLEHIEIENAQPRREPPLGSIWWHVSAYRVSCWPIQFMTLAVTCNDSSNSYRNSNILTQIGKKRSCHLCNMAKVNIVCSHMKSNRATGEEGDAPLEYIRDCSVSTPRNLIETERTFDK